MKELREREDLLALGVFFVSEKIVKLIAVLWYNSKHLKWR